MHAKTWFPSNEMHKSPNLTNGPLCNLSKPREFRHKIFYPFPLLPGIQGSTYPGLHIDPKC